MSAVLESERLRIRPFRPADLDAIHRILAEAFGDGGQVDDPAARAERRSWLEWSALSQRWLPHLRQPPYGERAVVLRADERVIGAVGLVPCLDRFEQLPALQLAGDRGCATPELGLFWVVDPAEQGRGYATEAARTLAAWAFAELRPARLIATTEHDNHASLAVMRKLGMRVLRNPLPDPPWLQSVGLLAHPATKAPSQS